MAQIDILKEILDYSLRKFNYEIIGANIYYLFNNERYAKAELKRVPNKNEFNGVGVTYISKLHGVIDSCDIYFKDVFLDQKRASVNVNLVTDEYDWFEQKRPTQRDLYRLALHIERYISIIGDFGSRVGDYLNLSVLASQAACIDLAQDADSGGNTARLEQSGDFYLGQNDNYIADDSPEVSREESAQIIIPPYNPEEAETEATKLFNELEIVRVINSNGFEEQKQSGADEIIVMPEDAPPASEPETSRQDPSSDQSKYASCDSAQAQITATSRGPAPSQTSAASREQAPQQPRRHRFSFLWNREGREPEVVDFKDAEFSALSEESKTAGGSSPFISWSIGTEQSNIVASLYEIERNTYRLRIYGSGRMQDFKLVPWSKYADHITELIIEDGIANIGRNAFKSLSILKSVELPDSIAEIGFSAFEFCSQLRDVKWPGRLRVIGSFAFSGTESLKNVKLPDSVTEIRDYAFDCTDGFTITHADPSRLTLGAGLHSSDFARDQSARHEKISINSYIGEDN